MLLRNIYGSLTSSLLYTMKAINGDARLEIHDAD